MERLKQKVASSSSRVIASLQQATGSFQPGQQAQPGASSGQDALAPSGGTLSSGGQAAWLMADATAHLTDQERQILLEVFKKEEQFQRDTIK